MSLESSETLIDHCAPLSDGSTYLSETESILSRTAALSPDIAHGAPEVLAAFAGLRPSREGGARVGRDPVGILLRTTSAAAACGGGAGERGAGQNDAITVPLVHNYGAGGTGFQAGYGMALDAVESVGEMLDGIAAFDKARL